MTGNTCLLTSGTVQSLNSKACIFKCYNTDVPRIRHLPHRVSFLGIKTSQESSEVLKCCSSGGINPLQLPAASSSPSSSSSSVLIRGHGGLLQSMPKVTGCFQAIKPPRAYNDASYSHRFPAMTEKPKWWWRTLACLQYLLPLHETIMISKISYPPHPFLKHVESFAFPFWLAIGRVPSWMMMAYGTSMYLGVVRRNECPHFFRFHVVMGLLLEYALQILVTVSGWMPNTLYCNAVGIHFWFAVAVVYLLMVLESMRCALAGTYADVPFFNEAACLQTPK